MRDLDHGGKHEQVGTEVDLTATLPPYDKDAADQNMLDNFKHVSIPPPAPAPDEGAVEIRVGDDASPFDDQQNVVRSVTYFHMTPHRASQEALGTALISACRLIDFDEGGLSGSVNSSSSQRLSSMGALTDSTSNASLPNLAGLSPLPALTAEDMMQALPHRTALFLPDSMEWTVLLSEEEVRTDGTSHQAHWPPFECPLEVTSTLWRIEGSIFIAAEEQSAPIYALLSSKEDEKLACLEDFTCWRDSNSKSILMNKKGSLPSVLPMSLLDQFRRERLANPRPGLSGDMQFKEAVCMLIKIVANVANGEVRSLSINGKALRNKLGFDFISEEILGLIGFSADGKPDEDGKYSVIKPPDMTQEVQQIKLRRAWLEIALWYQYVQQPSSVEAFWRELLPFIPLQPRLGSASSFLDCVFDLNSTSPTGVKFKFARPLVSSALRYLGADDEANAELVEECYLANTAGLSKVDQLPFYSALQVVAQSIRDDGGSDDVIHTRLAIEKSKGLVSEAELKAAYAKIGLEIESVEHANLIAPEFVLDIYMSAVNAVAGIKEEVQARKDALDIISASRNRPAEMEEQVAASVELSVEKAYEILEVHHDTDDDFISSVFSVAVSVSANLGCRVYTVRAHHLSCSQHMDGSKSRLDVTEALRVIAETRNSATLRKAYRTAVGEVEEWQPADLALPIGLNNIGNTCYLNSVLQYFFAIGKLREQVVLASREVVEDAIQATELPVVRVGGRQVSMREIERSHQFVRHLGQLFSNMTSAPTSAVTPERELAYLALVSSRVEETNEAADLPGQVISKSPEAEVTHLTRPTSDLQLDERQEVVTERPRAQPKNSDDSMLVHGIVVQESVVGQSKAEETHADDLSSTEADGIVTPPLPSPSHCPPLPRRPAAAAAAASYTHDAGQRRNSLMQLGAQQDVSECLDNVMFQVEVALTAAEQKVQQALAENTTQLAELDDGWIEDGDQLRRLFLGRTLQRLEPALPNDEDGKSVVRGQSIHIKREVFTILPIDVVEEGRDIYDGLDGFFDEEILTGSGGEPIRRTVTLTDAPAIMQIQLQRVQYDRVKGVYKSQAHLEVDQTLYMDRYLDFDPLDAADMVRLEKRRKGRDARRRVAELRDRLRALEPEKTPISQTLRQTSSFLSAMASLKGRSKAPQATDDVDGLDSLIDAGFSQFLSDEASRIEEESKEAHREIAALKASVEDLWKDEKRMEYVLTSVFMHRGEASHGHYFLNQRKLTRQDQEPSSTWFKYNDQTVIQVNWSDVHRDQSGATPYLLCWVRRDKLDHFDTLCRSYDVAPVSAAQPEVQVAEEKAASVSQRPPPPLAHPEPAVLDTVQQNDDTIMTDIVPPQ